jgi:deuterolysin
MKFATGLMLSAMSRLAVAAVVPRDAPGVKVELTSMGNTEVIATITNVGKEGVRLLKSGTILDPHPVRKVDVHSDGSRPPPSPSLFCDHTARKTTNTNA